MNSHVIAIGLISFLLGGFTLVFQIIAKTLSSSRYINFTTMFSTNISSIMIIAILISLEYVDEIIIHRWFFYIIYIPFFFSLPYIISGISFTFLMTFIFRRKKLQTIFNRFQFAISTQIIIAIITYIMLQTIIGKSALISSIVLLLFIILISNDFFRIIAGNIEYKSVYDISYKGRLIIHFVNLICGIIFVIFMYAHIYSLVGIKVGDELDNHDFANALYFSVVTWTTLGYGDIVPIHAQARFFAAIEAITGYIVMAIMIAALTSTIVMLSRQESGETNRK